MNLRFLCGVSCDDSDDQSVSVRRLLPFWSETRFSRRAKAHFAAHLQACRRRMWCSVPAASSCGADSRTIRWSPSEPTRRPRPDLRWRPAAGWPPRSALLNWLHCFFSLWTVGLKDRKKNYCDYSDWDERGQRCTVLMSLHKRCYAQSHAIMWSVRSQSVYWGLISATTTPGFIKLDIWETDRVKVIFVFATVNMLWELL